MTQTGRIRVIVVDDHKAVRHGLTIMVQGFSDLELVGEAANGQEAVHLCAELRPDVVLMDLVMPKMDGVQATSVIRATYPDIRIVALTGLSDQAMLQAALRAGVTDYLHKDVSVDELIHTIRAGGKRNGSS